MARKRISSRKERAPTKQQIIFADKYVELGNTEQAALAAGYKPSYARARSYKLLEIVGISKYIEKRMEELEKPTIANADEVLQYYTRVMRGEEKDAFGLDVSISDRNKAAEALGKRYGLFTDKIDMKVTGPTIIRGENEIED